MSGKDAGPSGRKGSEQADPAQSGDGAPNSGETELPKTQGIDAMAVLWTFGKCLSALLPVYLAGYYRVSTSLVVFGLMVYSGWKHTREAKEARLRSAIQLLTNEQEYTSTKVFKSKKDLPAWVNFPDVEKVEWLNKVLQQAWPFIGQYLEKLLMETIAPSIRASSAHLQTLNFTKIDMGDKAMKVVGVKAHTENDKGQVLLDVYISYVGDVEINVEVKRYFCKAGVKGIQLHGMMRVILEPLIGDVPIVGAVTMFFIRRPKLDINWTGLTNLLDIPGLNVMSDTMIMDAIASFLVLPNRLTVPLVADLHVAQLRCPLPRGVVRIHLLEADGLAAKDNYIKGVIAGMSDPYAIVRVGPQSFTSRHENNTVSPKWLEIYEVIVHEVPGQELEVEVYDKDADQDDFLGRIQLDLGIVKKSKVVNEWFPLKDARTGRVHLRLEWLTLLSTADCLEQMLKRNEAVISKTSDPPSAAILAVYLDMAEALPMKKDNKEPSPMVQLSVQDVTRESRTCWSTVKPKWEDAFTFFIQDPHKQDIDIQIKDNDRVLTLGSLSIPLSRLLSSPDLSLNQWFQLDNSGPASRVYINMVLRVLWVDEEALSSEAVSLATSMSTTLPQQTSPDSSFATEGVLRIHLLEAQNLVPKDNLMRGLVKGKSDPYVKINIGGSTFKSRVINGNLNPTWNEMYEVVLTQLPGQEVQLEVFDKDMDSDDFMGSLKIKLGDIISCQYTDQWFTLNDVKSGRVHLVLEWLPTVSHPDRLEQVLQFQRQRLYQNKAVPSLALLFVYVERAHALPLKKSGKEPKAGAELVLGGTSYRTKVCDRSISPQWDEAFFFLVRDPRDEVLIVKLSHSWDLALGSLVVPVRDLLSEPELVLDQWLSLDGALPDSQILLRAELKILSPKMATMSEVDPPKLPRDSESMQRSSAPVSVGPSAPEVVPEEVKEVTSSTDLRPQHTCPDPSFGTEGVLRIHLLEAQNLAAKDKMLGIMKGKSDPYVKINVGGSTFKSHVIKENLNPIWNEMYELVLTRTEAQEVQFEMYDKDMHKDDFMGRFMISMNDIINSQYTDQWFTLNDVKSGRVHLVLEWLPTVSHPDRLEQVLQLQSLQSYQNKAVPSAALLFVFMERAHSLPLKKSGKEPKAGAELIMGGASYRTKVCDRSTSPQWDEAFYFLVRDPREDTLIIKLSSGWDQAMGSLVLPVRELLSEPELVLDQWLSLDGAKPDSQILLRAELKVLDSKMAESDSAQGEPTIGPDSTVGGDSEEAEQWEGPAEEMQQWEEPAEETRQWEEPAEETRQWEEPAEETWQWEEPAEESSERAPPSAPVSVAPSAPDVVPEEVNEVTSSTDLRPQHTCPNPSFGTEGVLRIHLLEAQNLVAKDKTFGMMKGKSDPYVKINIGGSTFKSHAIKENLNPTWNEMYELVLTRTEAQEVQFEMYDKDMDRDDFMGRFTISMNDIINSQYTDQWFTLNDVKSGRVHLVLEWLPTVSHPDRLEQVLQLQSLQSYQNKAVLSAALLFVFMERAHSLPLKKSGKEPKAGAELFLGGSSYRTKVCDRSTSPQWDEAFYFLVRDPREDTLIIKLSSGWDQAMGSLVLPVRELLSEPELVLDQWLSLDGAKPDSQILLRAELKVLDSKMAERDSAQGEPTIGPDSTVGGDSEEIEPITSAEQPVVAASEEAEQWEGPAEEMQQWEEPVEEMQQWEEPAEETQQWEEPVEETQLWEEPVEETQQWEEPAEESSEQAVPTAPVSVSAPEDTEDETADAVIVDPRPLHAISDPGFGTEIEDSSEAPDTTSIVGRDSEETEAITTAQSDVAANEELQHWDVPAEQSREQAPPSAPVSVSPSAPDVIPKEVTSSTDLRPQHTCIDPSFGTEGVLRILLLEAQNLVAKDKTFGMMKGKSDPYVKINIGGSTFKSHVIKENLNPTWNEMYEVVLRPDPVQEVKFELYDEDFDSDDFLGRFKLGLGDIISSQYTDQWFTLNDVKSGRVHLVLEWLPTVSHPDRLEQVLQLQSLQSYQNKAVPSAALLFVFMERAHSLPLKKSGKEPKAGAELVLGGASYRTKVCDRSTSPQWDEAFYFLVHDPKKDILFIKLSSGWDQAMGSLVLPVRELLSEPELVLDQWLSLDGAKPDSQILLRAELKILDTKMADLASVVQGALFTAAPSGQAANSGQVKLSLSFKRNLTITVHACRGLVSSSKDGLDTYVSLVLLPDKNKATKRKTSVKKRDLNPEYNQRFEFDLSLDDARRRSLSLCVKNSSASFMSRDKDVVGQVQIDLAQIDLLTGATEWFDLKEDGN